MGKVTTSESKPGIFNPIIKINKKVKEMVLLAISALGFFVAADLSQAAGYELTGPETAEQGDYVEVSMRFSSEIEGDDDQTQSYEDVIAVGVIYSYNSSVESVEAYYDVPADSPISSWTMYTADDVSGSITVSNNQVGIGDYDCYRTAKAEASAKGETFSWNNISWEHILNGSENIIVFRIKIADDASVDEPATFRFKKVYYATTDNSMSDIANYQNLPTADGNSISITVTNSNPTYTTDLTMDKPVIANVSAKSATSNTITWNLYNNASGYYIYRKATGDSKWTKIKEITNGSTKTYTDSTAVAGTTYYYTIRAIVKDKVGNYKISPTAASMYTLKLPSVYSVNSTAQKKNVVKWNSVSGATGYKVYRRLAGGKWSCIATVTGTSYIDSAANGSTLYYYTVRAVRTNGGVTALSWYNSGKYSLKIPSFTLTASAKGKNVLKWNSVSGATSYSVYRKTANGSYVYIGSTTSLSYTDKTAKSGTKYYYAVRAVRKYTYQSKSYKDMSFYTGKSVTTK